MSPPTSSSIVVRTDGTGRDRYHLSVGGAHAQAVADALALAVPVPAVEPFVRLIEEGRRVTLGEDPVTMVSYRAEELLP